MKRIIKFLRTLGPGFITGASDDDPSGVATYSQTGALFGLNQLWLAPFSFPFMTVMQEVSGRIGLVTGRGIASHIRKHYPRPILYFAIFALLITNTINIGANLGAMASTLRLLVDIHFAILVLAITAFTLLLEIFVSYKTYSRFLKYLAFSLIAYVIAAFAVNVDWNNVLQHAFTPSFSFDKNYLLNIVAILGTTIAPYLFFWQASEEVEEEILKGKIRDMEHGKPYVNKRHIRRMRFDTALGMLLSNTIMFFIIITAASTLGAHGIHNIATADQAASALAPFAGKFTSVIFALGIIGTGLLAVPILAGSASYAVAEAAHWREGLYLKLKRAHGFYGVITIATILGLIINFVGVPAFTMLYYTAVINGIAAPPLMAIILLIGNNKRIMGRHINPPIINILGWFITSVMTLAVIFFFFTLLMD